MRLTLIGSSFPTVSVVFPPCYVAPVAAPESSASSATGPPPGAQDWPGQRLGLPATGSGSVAGWGRRLLAIFIDWIAATLAVSVFTGHSVQSPLGGYERWLPLTVFAIETIVLTASLGGSAGQLICRVQVRRLDGARLDVLRAVGRTILVCLVVPPFIYNADQRGLHDLAVGSIAVRR